MRLVADNTRYDGGRTLGGGSHVAARSQHGVCQLDIRIGNDDGGAGFNLALAPEDAVELAVALTKSAQAAKNWLADTLDRSGHMDGEA